MRLTKKGFFMLFYPVDYPNISARLTLKHFTLFNSCINY